jgi:hypothetical protein
LFLRGHGTAGQSIRRLFPVDERETEIHRRDQRRFRADTVAENVAIVCTNGAKLCLELGGTVVFDIRDGIIGCVQDGVDAIFFGDVIIVILDVKNVGEMDPIEYLRELTGVGDIEPCGVAMHFDGIEDQ